MASLKIDESNFDKLAEILKKHDLSEIEYKRGDIKIRVVAHSKNRETHENQHIQQNIEISHESPSLEKTIYNASHKGAITSPMVGTCYLSPEPGAKNFVSLGDEIQEGQPLLIIEAMKVMNLIKAPKTGKVVHIAVSNANPIEYGQLLLIIE
ncbi:MAG: acetyl-CoA carboxylase, biotin carboxyl carrier protein [Holosporales bacterium]|jgi:acetyl-CoA carboxylase biotin carboxyl carrier protein|nr:acetyl-CoA carboxylase, biotin carboxyl carrier protein [Holosporales bacterium]